MYNVCICCSITICIKNSNVQCGSPFSQGFIFTLKVKPSLSMYNVCICCSITLCNNNSNVQCGFSFSQGFILALNVKPSLSMYNVCICCSITLCNNNSNVQCGCSFSQGFILVLKDNRRYLCTMCVFAVQLPFAITIAMSNVGAHSHRGLFWF